MRYTLAAILILGTAAAAPDSRTISDEQLYDEFRQNNLRAQHTYSGHTYDVTGYFDNAADRMWSDGIEIRLGEHIRTFLGYADQSQLAAIMRYNTGDTITLRCAIDKAGVIGIPSGSDCVVIQILGR